MIPAAGGPGTLAAPHSWVSPLIGPTAAPGLHVMTFNVRRRLMVQTRRADRWMRRAPRIRALLQSERPSLLGVQEAMPDQASFVRHALGSSYRSIGRGRNADGRGEQCPLFYDDDRLELLDWQQLALSDRPTVAGSSSWGNAIPRFYVAASLRDRQTGARLDAINTHFDHLSRRSRLRSAWTIRERVAASGVATIVMGDLNTGENSAPITELLAGGVLEDAWELSDQRLTPEWGTFANYSAPRPNRKRIDWIAATPGIGIQQIAINPRQYVGGWPSDHLSVQAVVRIPVSPAAESPAVSQGGRA